jgi:predicted membrane channel-forming protein YqfA (hemolysin III family)
MIGPESELLATIVSWMPPTLRVVMVLVLGSSLLAMALLLRGERRAAFEMTAWIAPAATIVVLATIVVQAVGPGADLDDGLWFLVVLALGLAWFLLVACWWLTRSPRSRPRAKR